MGKRSRREKDEDYLKKKIRKLEQKLKDLPDKDLVVPTTPASSSPSPPAPEFEAEPEAGPSNDPACVDHDLATEDEQLPEEYLQALGTEGAENNEVGDPIRPELAVRWTKIMSDGLGKESRDTILKKYPTPSNFPRAEAPYMNAEIAASLSDISLKRDKRIVYRQNMIGKLMTCIGKSLTCLLKGNINSKVLIEEINDAAKIAADIHYQDSSSRKFFALSGADKIVKDSVRSTTIDEALFGTDCGDKLKAAQALKRTSSQIKATSNQFPNLNNSAKKQGNWKGPLPFQHQTRGGQHQQRQPAFKKQQFEQPHQRNPRRQEGARKRPRSRYHR